MHHHPCFACVYRFNVDLIRDEWLVIICKLFSKLEKDLDHILCHAISCHANHILKAWYSDSNGPKEVINCIVWIFSQSHKLWRDVPRRCSGKRLPSVGVALKFSRGGWRSSASLYLSRFVIVTNLLIWQIRSHLGFAIHHDVCLPTAHQCPSSAAVGWLQAAEVRPWQD